MNEIDILSRMFNKLIKDFFLKLKIQCMIKKKEKEQLKATENTERVHIWSAFP